MKNKRTNKETKTYKHKEEQGIGIWYKRNKRNRTWNGQIRVFGCEYACTYIEHACIAQLYMYAYFKYACAFYAYFEYASP